MNWETSDKSFLLALIKDLSFRLRLIKASEIISELKKQSSLPTSEKACYYYTQATFYYFTPPLIYSFPGVHGWMVVSQLAFSATTVPK